jgi:hypothetical protein
MCQKKLAGGAVFFLLFRFLSLHISLNSDLYHKKRHPKKISIVIWYNLNKNEEERRERSEES